MGNFEEGEVYLERCLEVMGDSPPSSGPQYGGPARIIPIIARITGVLNHLAVSEDAARAIYSVISDNEGGFGVRLGQALLPVLREDIAAVRKQYAELEGTRSSMVGPILCSDRILGLLSHTMGNLDQATKHFDDALAFCRKAGYRPELAWTCCDYVDTLLKRNEPGDREKAMSHLDESLAISSELGMRPLMERVLSRREILKA